MRFYKIDETGAKVIDIPNDYKEINKALGWSDAWNTPSVKLNGRTYIVICSDTGKIRHEKVSALGFVNFITPKETLIEPFLVGAILITKFNGIDDYEALNDEDIEIISACVVDNSFLTHAYPKLLILD